MNPYEEPAERLQYLLTHFSIERDKYLRLAADMDIAIKEIKSLLESRKEL